MPPPDEGTNSEIVCPMDQIVASYNDWKLELPENINELHPRTQRSWLAKYNPVWKSQYPWIEVVTVSDKVVGVLCAVCRSKVASSDSQFNCAKDKSNGKFIDVPFVRFGNFLEVAKVHEFGHSRIPACSVKTFRQQIRKGDVDTPKTLHLRAYLGLNVQTTSVSFRQHLSLSNDSSVRNEKALQMCVSLLHRTIKRRESPFATLKDNVQFCIEMLHCDIL